MLQKNCRAFLGVAIFFALFSTSILNSTKVHAHKFHAGLVDIRNNPRTQSIEIIHTYMGHDIDALIENTFQRAINLEDKTDSQFLQSYIEKRFKIIDTHQQAMKIKWVGIQVTPSYIMIYQEIENQHTAHIRSIQNTTLMDVFDDQANTINLTIDKDTGEKIRTHIINKQEPLFEVQP